MHFIHPRLRYLLLLHPLHNTDCRRFLNLYEHKKEAVSRQDALAKSMRRLMHVVLATTGGADSPESAPAEVVVEDPALRRRNSVDESTLLLTTPTSSA